MLPAPTLDSPLAEVVATVRGLAGAAAGSPAPEASGSGPADAQTRAAWLYGLRRVIDAAEAAFTTVLADFDAHGDGEVLHAASSTQAWLRGALGMASAEASERVRIARASRSELGHAVAAAAPDADGPAISYEHVRTIHRTLRALPPSSREEAADLMTTLAGQAGVDDVRAAGRYLRHVVDPDGSARHAEEDFGRRWLTLAPLLDGMHSVTGVLDAETAARLSSALAPFLVPTGPDDARTTDQRRADGLAEIVITAVASGGLPQLSGATTALQVEVPLETLTGDVQRPARVTSMSPTPTWLTASTAQRLSCDPSIRRLLLDPTGVPLDLGRETRVFSAVQRKALAVRDGGCRFPGCARAAAHTDAHHLVPWSQGGATDLANGLLLCRFHHRQVHEGGWHVASTAAGADATVTFTGPGGIRLVSLVPRSRGPSP